MEIIKQDQNTQFVRGDASMNTDYLNFIHLAFGVTEPKDSFAELLPKLYDGQFDAASLAYFVLKNGTIQAATGTLDYQIRVCGQMLNCCAIGNVGVHPESRGQGYMTALMNIVTDRMLQNGTDIGVLAGKRHRYRYFGYEKSGTACHFRLIPDSINHSFGKERVSRFTYRLIQESNTQDLNRINALLNQQNYIPIRSKNRLYQILRSWHNCICCAYEGNRFVGFAVASQHTIAESHVCLTEDYTDFIVGLYDFLGRDSITVSLPLFEVAYTEAMYPICDTYALETNASYLILNYEKVISALFKLKMRSCPLADGKLVLLIHGARDERLNIEVVHGHSKVCATAEKADLELDGISATNLLFSPYSPARMMLPSFAQAWFPLPLWMYHADLI